MSIISSVLAKTESVIRKLKNRALRADPQFITLEKWYKEDINADKRVKFDELDENSLIFDLGGYKGEWTSDIYSRYNSRIYVFEPVKKFANLIKSRFQRNSKITVYPFGLGPENKTEVIAVDEFASSIKKASSTKNTETIELKSIDEFITENGINKIDLMKINIEGAEYDLLETLLNSGKIKIVNKLLIQFHDFVPQAKERRQKIANNLATTHKRVFDYPFVWECWQKM